MRSLARTSSPSTPAQGASTLLSEALDPLGVPVALYEDDAGALRALTTEDAQLRLWEWTGEAWARKATWWDRPLKGEPLFLYEPSRGLLQLEPVTQVLWRLREDQWVKEGVLDLNLKIEVKPRGDEFQSTVEGVDGTSFDGATAEEARAEALRQVSAERYLAVYEPARKRVVALAHGRRLGLRCMELSPQLGRALPVPDLVPALQSKGLWPLGLGVDPRTQAAVLLVRPGQYPGQPEPQAASLGPGGWTTAGPATPAWTTLGSGPGSLAMLGVRTPDGELSQLAVWDGAWRFAGGPFPHASQVVAAPEATYAVGDAGLLALTKAGLQRLGTAAGLVATPGGFLTVDPDGTVRRLGEAKPLGGAGAFPLGFHATAVTWDPEREGLVAFGDPGPKMNTTWEFKAGDWKPVKAARKPRARQSPLLVQVPGVGLVMVGGWNKKHLSERCAFDGKIWAVEEPLGDVNPGNLVFLGYDAPTRSLLLGEATAPDYHRTEPSRVVVRRYVGPGQWEPVAQLEFSGHGFALNRNDAGWGFDPEKREVIVAGPVDGTGSMGFVAAPLSAVLDALVPARHAGAGPAVLAPAPAQSPRSEYHLVQKDEPPGKFWFATRQGSDWTASWGRRGAGAQAKTYSFPSPAQATTDMEKKAAGKLAEGYKHAPEGAAAAALASRDAWPMKLGKKAGKPGDDQLFSAPVEPPRCKTCTQPMAALGTFHAHPERLPLQRAAALALFQCNGACETWSPTSGANAVVFVDPELVKAAKPAATARAVTYPKKVSEPDREREGLPAVSPGGCKVGGYPTWVQDAEPQTCGVCLKPLVLAVQLDAGDTGMNFGDVGVGYALVCPDEHQGRFLWQCS